MKNIKKTYSKGRMVLAIISLFSLVLGSLLVPISEVRAEVVPAAVGITVSPGSICIGQTVHLQWTSENAMVSISPGIGTVDPMGQMTVSPTQTTTYTATGTNSTGGFGTADAKVTVTGPCQQTLAPTVNLTASPTSVTSGQSSTLTWFTTNNPDTCTASGGWSGSKNPAGASQSTGILNSTTTFNITCSNSAGSASSSATVSVNTVAQNPTVNLTANPISVSSGQSSILTWTTTNSTTCVASGGWSGNKNASGGSESTNGLFSTTTFNITCSNSSGSASSSATVSVGTITPNNSPTVNISADDTSISEGDSTIVRWNSNNANSCFGSGGTNGWSGSRGTSGSFLTGSLFNDVTYSITCTNSLGSASDSVTIRVSNGNNNNFNLPFVATKSATNVSNFSATLNGRVDGNGSSVRTWFEYGPTLNLGNATSRTSNGSGSREFDRGVSGLLNNTTYFFRAVAENTRTTVYGNILTFHTGGDVIIPIITPLAPTVFISADQTTLNYNGATNIRWSTTNASSCFASGGSVGWAGAKNIGPASFYTGSLTSSKTYSITCTNNVSSASDSVTVSVRGQQIVINTPAAPRPAPTSLVVISSSVDRNQPIVPTLDNTRPHPGDEINYTVSYQNIGTGSITNLNLRIDLPLEVDYMFSTPSNPTRLGNTLFFSLGTLRANGQGTVTVRVRVRDNIPPGTNLNFPAVLSYTDPSGFPQSVAANVSAQIWTEPVNTNIQGNTDVQLGANVFGAGFLPTNLFGWLLLFILLLVLVLLAKYLLDQAYRPRATAVYLPDSNRPGPRI